MIENLLLWFDLETTGLDEQTDHILEVGWGISTPKLDWVIEPISYVVTSDVLLNNREAIVNGARVDPYVFQMHMESDLWNAIRIGPTISLRDAQEAICSVLDSLSVDGVVPNPKFTMAGSGVSQFDMRWIRNQMPELHSRLTYYSIDMGTFERVETMLRGGDIRKSRSNAAHRAVDDIMFSYRLARRYKELLLVGADFDRANP